MNLIKTVPCAVMVLSLVFSTPAFQTKYVCPMHPEITSNTPASCSKCGMRLSVRKEATDQPAANTAGKFSPRIPDVKVLDQNGNELNFYSDLVKDRIVAINFIFTTCTTICPPLTATMKRVQQELGARVGRDVRLISVSVDPATDVPERLSAFSKKFQAGPGWTFVTGEQEEMDKLLKALGAYVSDKNDHSPTLLIGNDRTGQWTRSYGLAPAATTVKLIKEVSQ